MSANYNQYSNYSSLRYGQAQQNNRPSSNNSPPSRYASTTSYAGTSNAQPVQPNYPPNSYSSATSSGTPQQNNAYSHGSRDSFYSTVNNSRGENKSTPSYGYSNPTQSQWYSADWNNTQSTSRTANSTSGGNPALQGIGQSANIPRQPRATPPSSTAPASGHTSQHESYGSSQGNFLRQQRQYTSSSNDTYAAYSQRPSDYDQRSTGQQNPTQQDPPQIQQQQHQYQQSQIPSAISPQSLELRPFSHYTPTTRPSSTASATTQREPPKLSQASSENSTTEPSLSAAMASAIASASANSQDGNGGGLEAEMKAMFAKIRELNSKDPDMLSRLWREERNDHLRKESQKELPVDASELPIEQQQPTAAKKPRAPKSKTDQGKETQKEGGTPTKKRQSKGSKKSQATTESPLLPLTDQHANDAFPAVSQQDTNAIGVTGKAQNKATSNAAPNKTGTALWPVERQLAIAQLATKILNNDPANLNARITQQEVMDILKTNPSYVDLCRRIEQRGLKLDRRHFAKGLLSAIPDVINSPVASSNKSLSTHPIPSTTGSSTSVEDAEKHLLNGSGVFKASPAKTKSNSAKKTIMKASRLPTQATPSSSTNNATDLEGLEAVKEYNEASVPVPESERNGTTKTGADSIRKKSGPRLKDAAAKPSSSKSKQSDTPTPLTKEDKARKRSFGEMIDLSLLSDEEEAASLYPPPKRVETLESNSTATQQAAHSLPSPPQTSNDERAQNPISSVPSREPQQRSEARPSQPLNNTISAPRPFVAPQAPMMPVAHFPHSSIPSWHGVSAPILPVANNVPPFPLGPGNIPRDHPIQSTTMVRPIDKSIAVRRGEYDAKTIARDILIACGRHPEMRSLNAHYETMRAVFVPLRNSDIDLATLRWDVIDPGGSAIGSATEQAAINALDDANLADDEGDSDGDSVIDGPSSRGVATATLPGMTSRTARLKTGKSDLGTSILKPNKFRKSTGSSTPKNNTLPDGTPAPTSGGGYAALWAMQQSAGADGTPVKKKGRPVGWRKWMQKMPSDPPANKPSGTSRGGGNVGRPPKASNCPLPEPDYHVYKCEWQNCNAELHNLKTLRRHVQKRHGKINTEDGESIECHWSGCGKPKSITENGRVVSKLARVQSSNFEDFKSHLEVHLQPIAWKYGDGPAGGVSGTDTEVSDTYHSDAQGRRVTPTIRMPADMSDLPSSSKDTGIPSARPGAHGRGKRSAEEEARKEQWEAQDRRRRMGAGIDVEDSFEVTEKRAAGLVDDDSQEPRVLSPEEGD